MNEQSFILDVTGSCPIPNQSRHFFLLCIFQWCHLNNHFRNLAFIIFLTLLLSLDKFCYHSYHSPLIDVFGFCVIIHLQYFHALYKAFMIGYWLVYSTTVLIVSICISSYVFFASVRNSDIYCFMAILVSHNVFAFDFITPTLNDSSISIKIYERYISWSFVNFWSSSVGSTAVHTYVEFYVIRPDIMVDGV